MVCGHGKKLVLGLWLRVYAWCRYRPFLHWIAHSLFLPYCCMTVQCISCVDCRRGRRKHRPPSWYKSRFSCLFGWIFRLLLLPPVFPNGPDFHRDGRHRNTGGNYRADPCRRCRHAVFEPACCCFLGKLLHCHSFERLLTGGWGIFFLSPFLVCRHRNVLRCWLSDPYCKWGWRVECYILCLWVLLDGLLCSGEHILWVSKLHNRNIYRRSLLKNNCPPKSCNRCDYTRRGLYIIYPCSILLFRRNLDRWLGWHKANRWISLGRNRVLLSRPQRRSRQKYRRTNAHRGIPAE